MYDKSGKLLLKNLTLKELEEWCASVGESPRRARQLFRALYGNSLWIRDLSEMDHNTSAAYSAVFKAKVWVNHSHWQHVAACLPALDTTGMTRLPDAGHATVWRVLAPHKLCRRVVAA